MGRNKVTINERAKEYESEQFYVNDGSILMCRLCNRRLEWKKKDCLDKHVKSATHSASKNAFQNKSEAEKKTVKRQVSLSAMMETQKRAKLDKNNFVKDTVKMCLEANIPIHKLDHPAVRAYLSKYVPGSGDLPGGSTLRSNYVIPCGEDLKSSIKSALQDKPVVIVADETCDSLGRCVFAILFRTLTATAEQEAYLASCSFLETANGTTCCQAIIDCIKEYSIEYKNILGLVSDSARYMGTCFQALQTVVGDHLLHFQCFAHKLNLVGDVIVKELSDVNLLVTRVKMAFLHSIKMKNRYINFLREKYPTLPAVLFPAPIITRWNTWFEAVQYLDKYLGALIEFLNSFETETLNSSTSSIIAMSEDLNLFLKLRVQIKFVSEICVRIKHVTTMLEGSKFPFAHHLWNELTTISSTLKRYSHTLPSGTQQILNDDCKNAVTREKLTEVLQQCTQKCLAKLSKHMGKNRTNCFFIAVNQLFCPAIAGQSQQLDVEASKRSKDDIPFFKEITEDEFFEGYEKYHTKLVTCIRSSEEVDSLQVLLALKLDTAKFADAALKCLWAPTNSVDAERAFSKYNLVVSNRRTRMKEDKVETCAMLNFNIA